MSKKILLSMILGFGLFIAHDTSFAALDTIDIVTNCDGTQITRTAVGKIEITHGAIDLPGCVGKSILTGSGVQGNASSVSTGMIQDTVVTTSSTAIDGTGTIQTNCNGIQITRALSGKVMIARVEKNLPGCTNTNMINSGSINVQKYNPERGPALDIRSTDIVNYRTLQMKNKGIRYVDPTRSVKMRADESMFARVKAYLMRNDAVVISGKETGWIKTIGANIEVENTISNTVTSDSTGKASGYIASRYLRDPNASDLVRIKQADQAYWSDIAHVKVAHLVNVRLHPWHGSQIVAVLSNQTNLYIVSTIDNWSEVISDDRTLHGYIRSDFLVVDQAQRVDR